MRQLPTRTTPTLWNPRLFRIVLHEKKRTASCQSPQQQFVHKSGRHGLIHRCAERQPSGIRRVRLLRAQFPHPRPRPPWLGCRRTSDVRAPRIPGPVVFRMRVSCSPFSAPNPRMMRSFFVCFRGLPLALGAPPIVARAPSTELAGALLSLNATFQGPSVDMGQRPPRYQGRFPRRSSTSANYGGGPAGVAGGGAASSSSGKRPET